METASRCVGVYGEPGINVPILLVPPSNRVVEKVAALTSGATTYHPAL